MAIIPSVVDCEIPDCPKYRILPECGDDCTKLSLLHDVVSECCGKSESPSKLEPYSTNQI